MRTTTFKGWPLIVLGAALTLTGVGGWHMLATPRAALAQSEPRLLANAAAQRNEMIKQLKAANERLADMERALLQIRDELRKTQEDKKSAEKKNP